MVRTRRSLDGEGMDASCLPGERRTPPELAVSLGGLCGACGGGSVVISRSGDVDILEWSVGVGFLGAWGLAGDRSTTSSDFRAWLRLSGQFTGSSRTFAAIFGYTHVHMVKMDIPPRVEPTSVMGGSKQGHIVRDSNLSTSAPQGELVPRHLYQSSRTGSALMDVPYL